MWKAVESGWMPPRLITEEHYNNIKNNKDFDKKLTGYVGFALSFGGKWFGGYRRDKAGQKGCIENMKKQSYSSWRSMLEQSKKIKGVKFVFSSFESLVIPENSLIYCDPPYQGTTKYKNNFDHEIFWEWCRVKIKQGHDVFVSEYSAPTDFVCIWEKSVSNSLVSKGKQKKGIERVFVHRSQALQYQNIDLFKS